MKNKLLCAAAIAALLTVPCFGLGAGVASAATNANGSPLYQNQFFCGGAQNLTQTTDGFVNFHLTGTTVTMNYHVKGGVPNATDSVWGYDGRYCNPVFLGTFTTNANGVGNADFSFTVNPGATSVYTFAFEQSATQFVDTMTPLTTLQ